MGRGWLYAAVRFAWKRRLIRASVIGICMIGCAVPVRAALLYEADFSVAGQGCTHVTPGGGSKQFSAPSPVSGANWTLTYDEASISSDTTTNEFITTAAKVMRVQDWGGAGTLTSTNITVTQTGTVSIAGAALSIGTDAFNAGGEGITWFYQINDGTPVEFAITTAAVAGTDVGHTFAGVAVNQGDVLKVGFTVDVDGAGDGVEVSSLTVDFTAGPTSSGIDLRAFQALEGGVVEFAAYDVEADGQILLMLLDEQGRSVWSGSAEVSAGPEAFVRFAVPGLEPGTTHSFRLRDETGKWWEADGVPVQAFAAEMVSATPAGITLTFDTLPGHDYEVQWVPDLGSEWQTVTNLTASGAQTAVTVASPDPEEAGGFFRLKLK